MMSANGKECRNPIRTADQGGAERISPKLLAVADEAIEYRLILLHCMSPFLAQSGHSTTEFQGPLLGVKQTLLRLASMSANDPKRTWAGQNCCLIALCQEHHLWTVHKGLTERFTELQYGWQ